MNHFFNQVYVVLAQIPRGKVVSYGQIARLVGKPRAARQVGWAMRRCPEGLPWQRVVMADGSVTGGDYAAERRALLQAEGVAFLADGRVDMKKSAWL
jgi:methylated-DNA-protein-cysteine methyltransferase-like protein